MQAPDSIDVEATDTRMRGACLVGGCSCKDARIVSRRRAAFFAALAVRSGETARRVIAAEAEWRIPVAPLAVEASVLLEEPTRANVLTDTTHASMDAHELRSER